MKETNNFKPSVKINENFSEFVTSFRVLHKNGDIDSCLDWHMLLACWTDTCIKALEMRMNSCVSILFRNRNNVVKADKEEIVFVKKNNKLGTFNHKSFEAMEKLAKDLDEDNVYEILNNRLGLIQLLKALYWLPEEDRKEQSGYGFGELISFLFGELMTARES